jgi:tRNA(Ile)-lysidine synthase
MKDSLLKTVRDFLQRNLRNAQPLLLGYSGGPDSKALLELLLKCRSYFKFDLHLAHVDHGWRASSQAEAELLREEAAGLGLPFHLLSLEKNVFRKGNLEEQARILRLAFFSELYRTHGAQALLLGHQADDHAEVVLKRVCEGAHLSRLCGLSEVSILETMRVWRPLLSIKKQTLVHYLTRQGIRFFTDPTNHSSQFLRGRMRTELLPLLAKGFGKEIAANFCHLGKEAALLRDYFLKKISPYLEKIVVSERMSYLEIPTEMEEMELRFLLKEWFAKENIFTSREVLNNVSAKALHRETARFPARGASISVDSKRILILKDKN